MPGRIIPFVSSNANQGWAAIFKTFIASEAKQSRFDLTYKSEYLGSHFVLKEGRTTAMIIFQFSYVDFSWISFRLLRRPHCVGLLAMTVATSVVARQERSDSGPLPNTRTVISMMNLVYS